MVENEERWQYVAEYRHDGACVTKVRLHETPQNWRVLEAIPLYGSVSWAVREGKLIRKRTYKGKIFAWYDDALEHLARKLTLIEERARQTLNGYVRNREDIQRKLEDARAIGKPGQEGNDGTL